jgi:hypothetical protein
MSHTFSILHDLIQDVLSLYFHFSLTCQTIRYKRPDIVDDNGTERIVFTEIDKQTTPDRLTVLPWDEDAAFAALMCTKDVAR